MTREEAWNRIDAIIARHEIDDDYVTITSVLDYDALRMARKVLEQEPRTGHWIYIGNKDIKHSMKIVECDSCHKRNYGSSDYCPNCGAKMVEPQETETWNGIHAQITAPKGTFERIFNDADDEDDI